MVASSILSASHLKYDGILKPSYGLLTQLGIERVRAQAEGSAQPAIA